MGDDNTILVLRDYCIRMKGATCERCLQACPHAAISYATDERPVIDPDTCSHCGICLGICDAFTSTRVTMIDLHARMRRIALRGEEIIITCGVYVDEAVASGAVVGEEELAHNVVVVPCIATLSPEFWTVLLAEGLTVSVACDLELCEVCTRAPGLGEPLFSHAIAEAERWCETAVGFSEYLPQKENIVRGLANTESLDRRSVFTNFATDVTDITSGRRRLRNSETLQKFYEQKERARARAQLQLNDVGQLNNFAPMGRVKQTMWPKRQLLLEALAKKPEIAVRITVALSQTDLELCSNNLACTRACPTSARYPDPQTGLLTYDARYCIACGLCVDACPTDAVSIVEDSAAILTSDELSSTTTTTP